MKSEKSCCCGLLLLFVIFCLSLVCLYFFATPVFAESKTYTIVAGGDVMLGRRTAKNIENPKLGNGNSSYPWEYVAEIFRSADISFVNLEGVATKKGKAMDKKYTFRFKPEYMQGLVDSGIDIVSQANNHTMDFGREALCDSRNNIESYSIDVVGSGCDKAEAEESVIKILPDGTKVGFIAMSYFYPGYIATSKSPGFSGFGLEVAINQAKALKDEGVDIVVLSNHMGTEHKYLPNNQQKELYRAMIDSGFIDIVLGHHPHVPQPIEQYENGWIVYSLGNLIFDMHDRLPGTKNQILVKLSIQNKKITKVEKINIQMNDQFQPTLLDLK